MQEDNHFRAGGRRPRAGHTRGGHQLGAAKRGHMLLPKQRWREHAGERSVPRTARAGKAQGGA